MSLKLWFIYFFKLLIQRSKQEPLLFPQSCFSACLLGAQLAFTCSKSRMKTVEQRVKSVHS